MIRTYVYLITVALAAYILGVLMAAGCAEAKPLMNPKVFNKFIQQGTFFRGILPDGSEITIGAKHVCEDLNTKLLGEAISHPQHDICILPEVKLEGVEAFQLVMFNTPVAPSAVPIYHYSVLPEIAPSMSGSVGFYTNYLDQLTIGTTTIPHILITTNIVHPGDSGGGVFMITPQGEILYLGVVTARSVNQLDPFVPLVFYKAAISLFTEDIIQWMRQARAKYEESINVK